MAPTNAELAAAVTGVLTASRRFREMFGRATPEQQALVMASWPWPKRTLELREMTAWAVTTGLMLTADEPRIVLASVVDRLAG